MGLFNRDLPCNLAYADNLAVAGGVFGSPIRKRYE